jgi:hypothetical protein
MGQGRAKKRLRASLRTRGAGCCTSGCKESGVFIGGEALRLRLKEIHFPKIAYLEIVANTGFAQAIRTKSCGHREAEMFTVEVIYLGEVVEYIEEFKGTLSGNTIDEDEAGFRISLPNTMSKDLTFGL